MSANYKDTLLLPKTEFPMKADLVKREPERLAKWQQAGVYAQVLAARTGAPLFVLHDGPPFANGDVHMGTALNKVLKDLVVKSRTMLGFRAPFVPGWDCHGLPIEFKVVKEQKGLAPAEIRRRAEEFARKYIDIQRGQFKRLGVFGSWSDPYLTLAPAYEADIIRAFAGFVDKGLVYQSKKPVYWSTGAQTALAEAEVEYQVRTDPAIYVKFEFKHGPWVAEGAAMVIWTTTPWTLPANVAIAVDPRQTYLLGEFKHVDGRAGNFFIAEPLLAAFEKDTGFQYFGEVQRVTGEKLVGQEVQHPFLPRTSKIIAADFVTMDTGTGQVHIAPGHGKDDYIAGQQNGLPTLSPVDDYGKFTEDVGMPQWVGKYVFNANKEIVEFLREHGSLLAEQKYVHEYPHCWRSKTPIVFRAVEQFFIRIDDFRAQALAEIDKTAWLPASSRNRIAGTVASRPDWCISRQRTWGVPLPVFYDAKGTPMVDAATARKVADLVETRGTNLWFEQDDAWWAAQLGLPTGTSRRNDTLDVWIDSGVSHQAVLKRHPELAATGGVADVYLEATDQHRGWFQSSLMTSVALTGHAPYKTVITHGFVVDEITKNKIAKSDQKPAEVAEANAPAANAPAQPAQPAPGKKAAGKDYVKPTTADYFVEKYGADNVRLWAATVNYTDDVPFGETGFARVTDYYRNFRNVLRILLANLHDFTPGADALAGTTVVDKWVLSKLQGIIATCRAAYEAYDFRRVFETLNQFCTVELSSLYVDITKDRLYCDAAASPRRRATQAVMQACFSAVARLLAPILAYTADEAWEFAGHTQSIHVENFPELNPALVDEALETTVESWLKLRGDIYQQAIEPARQAKTIAKSLEAAVTLELPEAQRAALHGSLAELEEFFIVSELHLDSADTPSAKVIRSGRTQCARCWRYDATTGLTKPDLCDRCAQALGA